MLVFSNHRRRPTGHAQGEGNGRGSTLAIWWMWSESRANDEVLDRDERVSKSVVYKSESQKLRDEQRALEEVEEEEEEGEEPDPEAETLEESVVDDRASSGEGDECPRGKVRAFFGIRRGRSIWHLACRPWGCSSFYAYHRLVGIVRH